jgi:type II pantothenate kinase
MDVGATLAKLAARSADGDSRFLLLPSHGIERAAREVESLAPKQLGLTGAGAPALARLLGLDTTPLAEFDAWRIGAQVLLARQGAKPAQRDLLVSLGTGTSILLVEPARAKRVGGTALGGGTLLGLGAALLGSADYDALIRLAAGGDRRRVDLLVSDIDKDGVLPLPGEITASALAKLARKDARHEADPRDLAHALVGLVGENVGLLCNALALLTQAKRIVYGGSTLRDNRGLQGILAAVGAAADREVLFLADGEFVGAVGALELATGS